MSTLRTVPMATMGRNVRPRDGRLSGVQDIPQFPYRTRDLGG